MQKFIKLHGVLISLLVIILISFGLRTYQLSSVPASISIDEMAFGYNAYSLSQTGRDEYGAFLPFTLRAYDDYRPALLSYLIIPSIKLFGLSAFSIRFPSVILSLITLVALYRIVLLLFDVSISKKQRKPYNAHLIALIVVFLYAISPWNIYLSRLALDTNAGLTFFSVGLWIFLEYIKNKKLLSLLGSVIFFAVSFYAYNGIKFFIPFFLITLILLFYKTFLERKKEIIIAAILFLIILTPLSLTFLNNTNLTRFSSLDLFTQEQPTVLQTSSQRLLYEKNDLVGKIFDNRRIGIIPLFITNYLINVDPTWLYADDYEHQEYKTPDFGLFYFFELPLLLFGLYYIVKENIFPKKIFILLLNWLFFSIIPAAVTYDTPSAVRIYTALPAFLILEGCGGYFLLQWFVKQKKALTILLSGITGLIILISFVWFVHAYFVILSYQFSQNFSYGASDAISYGVSHQSSYKHIVVSNRGDLEFSYIYYLFGTKYDPSTYLKDGGTQSGNFSANHFIGKFAFIDPNLFSSNNDIVTFNPRALHKNTLYIVDAGDLPTNKKVDYAFFQKVHLLQTIHFLNGEDAIYIFAIK